MSLQYFSFVQSKTEIEFILKEKKNVTFIPLNLETLIFLKVKKLSKVDLRKVLTNKDFINFQMFSEKFVSSINLEKLKYEAIKIQFRAQIRFIIYSCIYILEILKKLDKNKQFTLIQSGWNGKKSNYETDELFLASRILAFSTKNEKIYFLTKDYLIEKQNKTLFEYSIRNTKISSNSILINNLGYNFSRIFLYKNLLQKVYRFKFENENEIHWFKKFFLYLAGYREIKIEKKNETNLKYFYIPEFKIKYGNFNISKIINDRKEELEIEASETYLKLKAINQIPNLKNLKFYFSYHNRGLDGSVSEILEPTNCETINISHGTVSKFYNKYDQLYKRIIAESVFSGKFKNYAIQSKICEVSLENTNKKIKKTLLTNNLIFSNVLSDIKNKNNILYAVTLKKFDGMQFYGVEMYYEFYENLKLLNNLFEKEKKIKIFVNLHSSHRNLVNELKGIFPKLVIKCEKIDKLINKSFAVISFSSTAIEDAISSNRFVILLDQWKRYRHFKGNIYKNLNTIFYVNNKLQLKKIIKILFYKKEEFNLKIKNSNIRNNFKKILKKQ